MTKNWKEVQRKYIGLYLGETTKGDIYFHELFEVVEIFRNENRVRVEYGPTFYGNEHASLISPLRHATIAIRDIERFIKRKTAEIPL